jgi:large subunit ribosomal protein L15
MPLQRRVPRLKGMARGPHKPARPKVYAPVNVGELAELEGDAIGIESSRRPGWSGRRRRWSRSSVTGRSGGRHGAGARLLEVREGEDRAAGGSVEVLER